eukprot:8115308-Pyramimonas_sp.AAC.1
MCIRDRPRRSPFASGACHANAAVLGEVLRPAIGSSLGSSMRAAIPYRRSMSTLSIVFLVGSIRRVADPF